MAEEVGNRSVAVPVVLVNEVNRQPQVVPVPVQPEGRYWFSDIIVPGPETEEGR